MSDLFSQFTFRVTCAQRIQTDELFLCSAFQRQVLPAFNFITLLTEKTQVILPVFRLVLDQIILNYETAITNRYAAWEQDLTERERAVKEAERNLEQISGE